MWDDLLWQTLKFSINVHDLILDNEFAIVAVECALTHIKLVCLR